MFRVGQKVVCINNETDPGCLWPPGDCPTVGRVYTVSAVGIDDDDDEVVQLRELKRSEPELPWYAARRFRPAVDRPTDISCFKAMLTPAERELVS